jgi:glyoxylase-like metal-dependent hydrolase (beta-lactamase superfamily II)
MGVLDRRGPAEAEARPLDWHGPGGAAAAGKGRCRGRGRRRDRVAAGVQLVPAPGHTLGHCVLTFASGAERAIFLADALLDQFQLTHPTWLSAADMVPDDTSPPAPGCSTPQRGTEASFSPYHVARIGHVERDNEGYRMI